MATESQKTSCLDILIEKGVIFLLVFTPLAFGAVQEWSTAVMEIAAFLVFSAWLIKKLKETEHPSVTTGLPASAPRGRLLRLLFIAFCLIILLQMIPLPGELLRTFSKNTAMIYENFAGGKTDYWHTLSINYFATRSELLKLLAYAAVFIVVSDHYKSRQQIKSIVWTIIFIGCFIAIFGVAQKLTWNGKLYWIFPINPGLHSNTGYIWGPYINHNHFAAYMEMAIPLGLGYLVYRASKLRNSSRAHALRKFSDLSAERKFPVVVGLFLAVLIMSASLFVSLSRGGILGFVAATACFTAMTRARKSLRKKTGIIVMAGLVLSATTIFASWDRIEDRFSEISEDGKIKRTEVWVDAVKIIKDFPIFGTGFGTFKNVYPLYQSKNANLLFEHAENDYIEILTDMGAAGFIIMICIGSVFIITVTKAWQERRSSFVTSISAGGISSCAAIAVHSMTDFNLRIPANALLLTVIAALTYAVLFNIGAGTPRRVRIYNKPARL